MNCYSSLFFSVFGPNSTPASHGPTATQSSSLVPTSASHRVSSQIATSAAPASNHNSVSIVPDHSVITMSTVMENLHAQTQPLIKEFNYLELD